MGNLFFPRSLARKYGLSRQSIYDIAQRARLLAEPFRRARIIRHEETQPSPPARVISLTREEVAQIRGRLILDFSREAGGCAQILDFPEGRRGCPLGGFAQILG